MIMQTEVIDSIKFGIVSPDDAKKISVVKLTVPDTYNEDGYPIEGGLLDQRMGVIDPGLLCGSLVRPNRYLCHHCKILC